MGDTQNEPGATTIWCPYLGTEVPIAETSDEHIVPLSLGGHNALTVRVHGRTNSTLGSKIDGEVGKELLIARQRVMYDARGHSGKEPPPPRTEAREKGTNKPLTLNWGKRLEIYDPVARRARTGVTFETTFKIDLDIRLRFLAKCFLSAGYLVYGELFRRAVEHSEPRLAMNKPPREFTKAEGASFRTRIFGWYHGKFPDEKQTDDIELQKGICALDGSVLVLTPGPGNLAIFGGVLGAYLGMLNVPADTTDFPRMGDYDLGHALVVSKGEAYRGSFRDLLKIFLRFHGSTAPETRLGPLAPDAG